MDHAPRTTFLGPSLAFGAAAVCRRSCRAWALASLARPWDNSALLPVRQRQVGGHFLQLRPASCVRACGTDSGAVGRRTGRLHSGCERTPEDGRQTVRTDDARKEKRREKEGLVTLVTRDWMVGGRWSEELNKRRRPRGEGLGLQGCASARPRQGLALIRRLAAGWRRAGGDQRGSGWRRGGGRDAALPGTGSPDVRRSPPRGAGEHRRGVRSFESAGSAAKEAPRTKRAPEISCDMSPHLPPGADRLTRPQPGSRPGPFLGRGSRTGAASFVASAESENQRHASRRASGARVLNASRGRSFGGRNLSPLPRGRRGVQVDTSNLLSVLSVVGNGNGASSTEPGQCKNSLAVPPNLPARVDRVNPAGGVRRLITAARALGTPSSAEEGPGSDALAEGWRRKGGAAALGWESAPRRVDTPRRVLESEGKGADPRQSWGARGGPTGTPSSPDGRAGWHGRGMNGPRGTAWPDPVRSRRSVRPHSSEARRRELVGGPTRRTGVFRPPPPKGEERCERRDGETTPALPGRRDGDDGEEPPPRQQPPTSSRLPPGATGGTTVEAPPSFPVRECREPRESKGAKRERIVDTREDLTRSRSMIAWSHSSSNSRQPGRVSARTMLGTRGDDLARGTEAGPRARPRRRIFHAYSSRRGGVGAEWRRQTKEHVVVQIRSDLDSEDEDFSAGIPRSPLGLDSDFGWRLTSYSTGDTVSEALGERDLPLRRAGNVRPDGGPGVSRDHFSGGVSRGHPRSWSKLGRRTSIDARLGSPARRNALLELYRSLQSRPRRQHLKTGLFRPAAAKEATGRRLQGVPRGRAAPSPDPAGGVGGAGGLRERTIRRAPPTTPPLHDGGGESTYDGATQLATEGGEDPNVPSPGQRTAEPFAAAVPLALAPSSDDRGRPATGWDGDCSPTAGG
ncbi:hypothetical protein THAOC_35942 [Thalassiosira oceanica]|uniref:Uncharacterized protein n=1 Tax=Thalassiosira oceanica TaxID=159749 RepID=K0R059_THAOC|nr:hypothetical protein THAOC_35942 [Thalassiosira oceanica]|eukprot:EJK45443.1 hypothetical protein THAOC_35942 [Thalassiosira oceanica]